MKYNILNSSQAAIKLKVTPRYLQHDRVTKQLIPFIKIGRFVRYREEDLDNFVEENRHGGGAA